MRLVKDLLHLEIFVFFLVSTILHKTDKTGRVTFIQSFYNDVQRNFNFASYRKSLM